jgi:hypothetical protein
MTRISRKILTLCLCLAPALTAIAQTGNTPIHWLNYYPNVIKEAKATGKPILLSFRCVP